MVPPSTPPRRHRSGSRRPARRWPPAPRSAGCRRRSGMHVDHAGAVIDVVGHPDEHGPLAEPGHEGQRAAEPVPRINPARDAGAALRVADLRVEIGHREDLDQPGVGGRAVLHGTPTANRVTGSPSPGAAKASRSPNRSPVSAEPPTPGVSWVRPTPAVRVLIVRAEQLDRAGIALRANVLTGDPDRQPGGATDPDGVQAAPEPVAPSDDSWHAGRVLAEDHCPGTRRSRRHGRWSPSPRRPGSRCLRSGSRRRRRSKVAALSPERQEIVDRDRGAEPVARPRRRPGPRSSSG